MVSLMLRVPCLPHILSQKSFLLRLNVCTLDENGKHDRLKICSISRVIGSSLIVSIPACVLGGIGKCDKTLNLLQFIGSNPLAGMDVSKFGGALLDLKEREGRPSFLWGRVYFNGQSVKL